MALAQERGDGFNVCVAPVWIAELYDQHGEKIAIE